MIRQMLHSLFMLLPADERMRVATWRFAKVRESFYTRNAARYRRKKGVRNRETMLERLPSWRSEAVAARRSCGPPIRRSHGVCRPGTTLHAR